MKIVFTDLDGTLLDCEDYSFEAARPALEYLKVAGIPCIFVTSKTRAEVEYWRRVLDNEHPFVVENGGAAFLPQHYLPFRFEGVNRNGYIVIEWGVRYERLVEVLDAASLASQCRVRGFHQMTVAEVAETCDMPVEMAALAKMREYDEPFQILDPARSQQLLSAIEQAGGLHWTRGGRFWHIMGPNDKAKAVLKLCSLLRQTYGKVETIGLGDGINDARFLHVVDHAIIMPSPFSQDVLKLAPRGILATYSGPRGWNDAVLAAATK